MVRREKGEEVKEKKEKRTGSVGVGRLKAKKRRNKTNDKRGGEK